MIRMSIVFVLVLICSKTFAQGEAAMPLLVLPTSPGLNGAGATGTASLRGDPYKFFFNPAHLGSLGKGLNFSSGFYPEKVIWFPGYSNNLTLDSYAFTAGYDLQRIYPEIPLSIGIGYSRAEINFGQLLRDWGADLTDNGRDYYSSYSLGIGYRSVVNINFGFTVKNSVSFLRSLPTSNEMGAGKAEGVSIDYGFIISLPLKNLIRDSLSFRFFDDTYINSNIDYTLGYTIQNIGDKVYYIDITLADPISRTARLAHNLQIGLNLHSENCFLELINFSYSIDAEDILIKRVIKAENADTTFNKEYQGLLGDIKPIKNLFLAKGNPEIVLHKGLIVEFFETIILSSGGFDVLHNSNRKTNGIGFRSRGLIKLINIPLQSKMLKYISDHFDIQYFKSNYYSGSPLETKFNGVYITAGGF